MSTRFLRPAALLMAGLLALHGRPAAGQCCKSTACARPAQRVYQVAELVVPLQKDGSVAPKRLEERLMHLITATVAPESWSEYGGRGTMDYFPLGMSLVVTQTPDVHERIQELLDSLRKTQDVQVSVQVCLLTVDEKLWEQIRPGKKPQKVTLLDDAQMLKLMEAAQCDADTCVMQAPKVTVFNGQDADFNTIDTENYVTGAEVRWDGDKVMVLPKTTTVETGLHLSVLPVISADGRSVKMHFEAALRELAHKKVPTLPVSTLLTPVGGKGPLAPFVQAIQTPKVLTHTLERTLSIPDGKTALLDGIERPAEHEGELDPPCITKIPYIKRLFKNVGFKSQRTVVLVTPRVIAPVEEEKKGGHECCEAGGKKGKVAKLLEKYHHACKEGKKAEARKLALKALAIDPTCFHGAEAAAGAECGGVKGVTYWSGVTLPSPRYLEHPPEYSPPSPSTPCEAPATEEAAGVVQGMGATSYIKESPKARMERLLNNSEDRGPIDAEWVRPWVPCTPVPCKLPPMSNDRIHGGIE